MPDYLHSSESHRLLAYGAPTIAPTPVPPTVDNVTPPPGTISETQALGCDVTDADGAATLRRVILVITLPTGVREVVHDGDAFAPPYATSSSRTSITNGYRYAIVRDGGWPLGGDIDLTPYVIDETGEEAA